MPASINIRAYQTSDLAAIEALGEEILQDGTVFPFEELAGILDYWFSPAARVFVAVVDATVAGTYALKPNLPGRGAHVANAGYMVATAFRERGVGQALGRHSIHTARELGFTAMQYNHVVASNDSALRLWQKLGFEVVGRVPRTFRHPALGLVDTCVMYRNLLDDR